MKIKNLHDKILAFCQADEIPYKGNKNKLRSFYNELNAIRFDDLTKIEVLISLHRGLSQMKNRKASYLEEEIARLILFSLPFNIRMKDEDIPEDVVEVLKDEYQETDRDSIKMSSALLKYAKEVIASKEDKAKRYKKRVAGAIRILSDLQDFYEIEGVKEIFKSKIEDKDEDLQFFALSGLEIYYAHETADDLIKEEEKKLEEIIKSTKVREIASTCCNILINTGKIDEFGAIIRIDNWKARNWN